MAVLGLALGMPAMGQSLETSTVALTQDKLSIADAVRGILGYARWPTETANLRLCVVGHSPHAEQLLKSTLEPLGQRSIKVTRVASEIDIASQCEGLYVGNLEDATWRRLFAQIAGRPVLTICERSPACTSGGMFCLDIDDNAGVQFEINLDSVARSGVRVNPQVLRLGRRPPKGAS